MSKVKLYTKEDFLKAAEFCEVSMIDARYIIERIDEVTDPIELPSDEEIHDLAPYEADTDYDIGFHHGWIEGAKQICNRIQGGNK